MKEATFIRHNLEKWERSETMVRDAATVEPDELAAVYVDITTDLSYAQTHYPKSSIVGYLNGLSSALHNEIYRNKREPLSRFVTFWTREVPQTMYQARGVLLASFIIFVVAALIGAISQQVDPTFCRLIMGDHYMDMTEANIAAGNPMGVYGSEPGRNMFGSITYNNIYVSFVVFVMGIFTSLGTGWMLFQNGIMIGCFDAFFAQKGMLSLCLVTTMLHGTLELSAIVIAGAAGIMMGNGWLFPGSYPRLVSFRRAARRGLKIVVATVPLFIVAGFIESFITRQTHMPLALKLTIIALSAAFVIGYYVVLPWWRHKNIHTNLSNNNGKNY